MGEEWVSERTRAAHTRYKYGGCEKFAKKKLDGGEINVSISSVCVLAIYNPPCDMY